MKNTIYYLSILFIIVLSLSAFHSIKLNKEFKNGWYLETNEETGLETYFDYLQRSFTIESVPFLTSKNIARISLKPSWNNKPDSYMLAVELDEEGKRALSVYSEKAKNSEKHFVIIIDNKIVTVFMVMGKVTEGKTAIYGSNLSKEDLETIMEKLKN